MVGSSPSRSLFLNRHEIFGWDTQGDTDVVVAVDDDLIDDEPQDLSTLLGGQVIQPFSNPAGPLDDVRRQDALLGCQRRLGPVVIELCPGCFQPFEDGPPLMVELALGDLAGYVQPYGPLLFHLHSPELTLRTGGPLREPAVLLRVQ